MVGGIENSFCYETLSRLDGERDLAEDFAPFDVAMCFGGVPERVHLIDDGLQLALLHERQHLAQWFATVALDGDALDAEVLLPQGRGVQRGLLVAAGLPLVDEAAVQRQAAQTLHQRFTTDTVQDHVDTFAPP